MSFTANNNLKNTGFPTVLKDWQHAARMFNDQQFRLAPKLDFQFHVAFNINTAALKNANIYTKYGNEINMLVKGLDLPTYTVQVDTLNQYNRKKNIQYQHSYGELSIKFHDDNMGLINQMWQNYYSYYYADSTSAAGSGNYNRTAMKSSNYINSPYGLDNGSTAPFFNYIKVYQMARHEYISYQLVNPIITSWSHNKLDYAQTKTHDFDMKIKFEAVAYGNGVVTPGDPEGFGISHYDVNPSPLAGVNPDPTVFDPSFVQALDLESAAPAIINNTISTVNTYQNTQLPTTAQTTTSVSGSTTQTIGGISGVAFPTTTSANNTVATPVKLGS